MNVLLYSKDVNTALQFSCLFVEAVVLLSEIFVNLNAITHNSSVSENAKLKINTKAIVIYVLMSLTLSVVLMVETTRTNVCADAKEIVRSTLLVNVQLKNLVLDVLAF